MLNLHAYNLVQLDLQTISYTQIRQNSAAQTHHPFCLLAAADFRCAPVYAVTLADTCNFDVHCMCRCTDSTQ